MKRKVIFNILLLIFGLIGLLVCTIISFRDLRDTYGALKMMLKLIPLYILSGICCGISIKELIKFI